MSIFQTAMVWSWRMPFTEAMWTLVHLHPQAKDILTARAFVNGARLNGVELVLAPPHL